MKIEKLEFKNLNSLMGHFIIDFTAPEYDENGLFLITGKTGSGKSTILDAIALALFGKTPRLNGKGNNTNTVSEIMSKGATECFSEVSFSQGDSHYRSRWSIRTKRTGTIDSPKVELVDLDEGEKVLSNQINDWQGKISTLLETDFGRFCRSVLLAQGQFNSFLKAKKEERSTLLEKITDTNVYGTISTKVYEMTKEQSAKVDALAKEMAEITILSPEEVAGKKAEINRLEEEAMHLKVQAGILADAKRYQGLKKRLQGMVADQTAKNGELEAKKESFKTAASAESAFQTAKDALLIRLKEADNLDVEKRSAKEHLDTLQKSHERLDRTIIGARRDQKASEDAIAKARMDIEKATAYLREHKGDEEIISIIPLCQQDQKTLLSIEAQIAEDRKKTESLRIRNAALSSELEKLEKTLMTGLKDEELLLKEKQDAEKELESAYNGDMPEQMQQKLKECNEKLRAEQLIASFDQQRDALQPGVACPLCGSLEHPFATNPVPSDSHLGILIRETEARIALANKANGRILKADTALNGKMQTLTATKTRKAGYEAEAKSNEIALSDSLAREKEREKEGAAKRKEIILRVAPYGIDAWDEHTIPLLEKRKETFRLNGELITVREKEIASQEAKGENATRLGKEAASELQAIVTEEKEAKDAYTALSEKRLQIFVGNTEERRIQLDKEGQEKAQSVKMAESACTLLEKTIASIEGQMRGDAEAITEIESSGNPFLTTEENELATLSDENEQSGAQKLRDVGSIEQAIEDNDEASALFGKKQKLLEKQQETAEGWSRLNELIGSKNGALFRDYAQSITFAHLLKAANQKLKLFSPRYLLGQDRDNSDHALEFYVSDSFESNTLRPASGLSGGESFLVSLSLALALSTFAEGKLHIESMFLDEGFGTLDQETLVTAIEALLTLKTEGKNIGIITHVESFRDYIPTQIKVVADRGKSTLTGPGITKKDS